MSWCVETLEWAVANFQVSSEESSAGAWARAGVGQRRAGETFPRGTCQAPFLPSPAGEAIPLRTRPTSARCWITALPVGLPNGRGNTSFYRKLMGVVSKRYN